MEFIVVDGISFEVSIGIMEFEILRTVLRLAGQFFVFKINGKVFSVGKRQ